MQEGSDAAVDTEMPTASCACKFVPSLGGLKLAIFERSVASARFLLFRPLACSALGQSSTYVRSEMQAKIGSSAALAFGAAACNPLDLGTGVSSRIFDI